MPMCLVPLLFYSAALCLKPPESKVKRVPGCPAQGLTRWMKSGQGGIHRTPMFPGQHGPWRLGTKANSGTGAFWHQIPRLCLWPRLS